MKNTIIIAEAGVNHNGDMSIAKKLIEVAADCGADYVKFQTFKADELVSRNAKKADYQIKYTSKSETHYQMIKRLELTKKMHETLINHCEKSDIKFMSSPFGVSSVKLLNKFQIDTYKIPSGEITNFPMLKFVGGLEKNIILSTGMASLNEIKDAVDVLYGQGLKKERLIILHCNTEYPTPYIDVNLKAMKTIQNKFGTSVGYSDHTEGIEVSVAAVAIGAEVIEKHFTLDKKLPGPDHNASLEPVDLKKLIVSIRNIDIAMGDGIKIPSKSEMKNISIARKSLVASKTIKKGEEFNEKNIIPKRPGVGISPMMWESLIGQKSPQRFDVDDLIEL